MTTDFDRWNHHRFKHSKDGPGRDHSNAPSRPGRSSISPLPADPGRMQPGPSPDSHCYVPYGLAWERAMMRMTKPELITLFRETMLAHNGKDDRT